VLLLVLYVVFLKPAHTTSIVSPIASPEPKTEPVALTTQSSDLESPQETNEYIDELPLDEMEPPTTDPVIHSILTDDATREMAYLWMEDVLELLHDPVQGVSGSGYRSTEQGGSESPQIDEKKTTIFSGREIVDWIMRHFHLPLRTIGEKVALSLLQRGYFRVLHMGAARSVPRRGNLRISFDDDGNQFELCSDPARIFKKHQKKLSRLKASAFKNPPETSTHSNHSTHST